MNNKDFMTCPKCNSTRLDADERDVSIGNAIAGAALVGHVGALAGLIGSGATRIDCYDCNYRFKPDNYEAEQRKFRHSKSDEATGGILFCILFVVGVFISISLFGNDRVFWGWAFSIATAIIFIPAMVFIGGAIHNEKKMRKRRRLRKKIE